MDNLELYNKVREVPENAQKKIQGGRLSGFTDINPMWRIKVLTEQFGKCGIGWWYTVDNMWTQATENGEVAAFVSINLYYKDPATGETSRGVFGTGGSMFVANEKNGKRCSDEAFKMALTDAISVAAKALGVGADVYWDKDVDKYDGYSDNQSSYSAPKPQQKAEIHCEKCGKVLPGGYKTANGTITAEKFVEGTQNKTGMKLCASCFNQWNMETKLASSTEPIDSLI